VIAFAGLHSLETGRDFLRRATEREEFMENEPLLAVVMQMPCGLDLNHRSLQRAALWQDEAVAIKKRLRENGFDLGSVLRRSCR
jgi:hypothetical protein